MADFDDNWVTRTVVDDTLVAYVLLSFTRPSLNIHWSGHQRGSKFAGDKKAEPNRDSPTTPLSWGGTTSDGDGCEESTSRPAKPEDASRSDKVGDQSEAATAKKRRKRRELASMNLTVEKQRATNKSLKRMKLDLASRPTSETATTPPPVSGKAVVDPPQLVEPHSDPSTIISPETSQHKFHVKESPVCAANASPKQQDISSNQEPKFLLPDLNMPIEEDDNSDVVPHEIS